MIEYTFDDIHHRLTWGDPMFLECGGCTGEERLALAQAEVFLRDEVGLHSLKAPASRVDSTNLESMDDLLETLAAAAVNKGSKGHLYFECASCGEENVADSPTVGRLGDDSQTRAVFLRGSLDTYPRPARRPLRWQPPTFRCETCHADMSPEGALQEGPDAPEIGWNYIECPKCGETYHPDAVKSSPTAE